VRTELVERLSRGTCAALAPLLVLPPLAWSQVPVQRIDDEPACAECVIERYLVATVHDRDYSPGAITDRVAVHPTSSGRFFVTSGAGYNQLFLTDEQGSVVRQVGAVGQGPGEFMDPRFVLETPSAFAVFDRRQGRITTLDKESLQVVRTIRIPVVGAAANPVMFDDGTFVVSEASPTSGPFHVTSRDGEVVESFGSLHEGMFPRTLARSGDSALWATYARGYRLEKWSREGELLKVLERVPDWWVANSHELEVGDQYTFVGQIHEDEAGLLWVHIHVLTKTEERSGFFEDAATKASIIEVLDPSGGKVVASTRFRGVAQLGQSNDFSQMVLEETPMGVNLVKIWGNRLHRGSYPPLDRGGL